MAENSDIEWTDHTFNPWFGCTKVSPGCDNCYAERLMETRWHKVRWGNGQPRVFTSESNWAQPVRWHKRAAASGKIERVFCASLADVFDSEVPDEWRARLFDLIRRTWYLDWLLLTKRPHIAQRYTNFFFERRAWLGISAENQETLNVRLPVAISSAPQVFISAEPLLGPLDLSRHFVPTHGRRPGWVIVGGESGPGHRPMDPDWARAIRDHCAATGVPFFMKQMAGRTEIPADLLIRQTPWEQT